MKLSKRQLILILVIVIAFFLVYSPHLDYKYPFHIDEWRHITESINLKENYFPKGIESSELGFHYFLLLIGNFFNLIFIYKYLPAIWAILSILVLYYFVRNKTSNLKESYFISIFSIVFFISIKSNVNLTGLWFFTPLTFSIPFIFLYIFLFSEGILKENKKYILFSLIIMTLLLFVHPISIIFAVPFMLVFSFFHINYIKREYRIFLLFLLIPILGFLFFARLTDNIYVMELIKDLLIRLQFREGWGVLELKNSFFEIYSPIGYLLSIIGVYYIVSSKKKLNKYLIYLLWPLSVLIFIFVFKLTGVSYLSPYQRNLYYFAISLPFLSSLGLYFAIKKIKNKFVNKNFYKLVIVIVLILVAFLTFRAYYEIPENIQLYKPINDENYNAILFLSGQPNGKVMAPTLISVAIFPISRNNPVATPFFYGDFRIVERFFRTDNCQEKNEILLENNVSYILTENKIDCNWNIIYNKEDIIYQV